MSDIKCCLWDSYIYDTFCTFYCEIKHYISKKNMSTGSLNYFKNMSCNNCINTVFMLRIGEVGQLSLA